MIGQLQGYGSFGSQSTFGAYGGSKHADPAYLAAKYKGLAAKWLRISKKEKKPVTGLRVIAGIFTLGVSEAAVAAFRRDKAAAYGKYIRYRDLAIHYAKLAKLNEQQLAADIAMAAGDPSVEGLIDDPMISGETDAAIGSGDVTALSATRPDGSGGGMSPMLIIVGILALVAAGAGAFFFLRRAPATAKAA